MANRPNILALASKISLESMTYTGITYKDPEYRILEPIVDDDMCSVMMRMRLEKEFSAAELAKKCKKSVEFVQEQCDKLVNAGVIRVRYRGEEPCYYYPIWVPGIMEGILSNRAQCDKYPDLGACFEEYTRIRVGMLAPVLGNGVNFMRVMPVMSAIESNTRTASYDELATIIEKAKAISVGPCSCRRSRRLIGEGCGHLEEDMCMYLDDNAINFSKHGEHRLISKEEAYEILKRAEDNGLVHEVNQALGFDGINAICNCCGCSCYALRIAELFRSPDGVSSNFIAKVDKDKCVACGQCVENCQTNAVKLGQKLCTTDPHVSDAYQSDKEVPWDKKSYNVDYRTTRTDVMESGTAPCKAQCPAHVPVQGYIKLAAQGRYTEALELIKKENPFPAVCGRICNKACEDACTRGDIDSPIAIDDIKKFIAEKDLESKHRFVPKMVNQIGKPYEEKIAVIGAGPAGLSCAYYLAVKGYPVTVYEKEKALGGMLTMGIPSFRLEKDVINAEIKVLKDLGVKFKTGVEVGKDITLDKLREQGFKAFYLAVGASKGAKVGCPGDELPGVMTGIDFLREVNLGEKPAIGKNVAVIGGGNVAMDVVRTAVRLGAEEAYIVYRRSEDEMPADKEEVAEAMAEGVKFCYLNAPVEITGTAAGKVNGLKVEIMELGEPDEKGRRKPVGTGKFKTIKVNSVIGAIGQTIDWGELDIGALKTAAKGVAMADPVTLQTAQEDIFVGGDCYTGPKFAIDAIAAGREGAISLHRYVQPGQSLTLARNPRDFYELDKDNVVLDINCFDAPVRQEVKHDPRKAKTMKNDRVTFTEEQVKAEASRCLGCGVTIVDQNKCIGCGLCTTRCEFDAIHLHRDHPDASKMVRTDDKIPPLAAYAAKRAVKINIKDLKEKLAK